MAIKILKIVASIVTVVLVILTLLYVLAPYFIKSRMVSANIKYDPEKYKGLGALPENSKILFVTAHPDDLEFMSGGTLPKLIDRKNDVYMVILTDGGKQRYMPKFYSKRIVATRHKDQLAIAKVEGLKKVFFLNYPDGSLKFNEAAVKKVQKLAQELNITHIFTFEYGKRDGYYDSDHNSAGHIGTEAAKKNGSIKAVYYFRPKEPDIIIDISDTFERKLEVMFMFTEFKYKHRMLDTMHRAWASVEGKRIGVQYAEGFRIQPFLKRGRSIEKKSLYNF